jgi:hypothetical protein
MKKALLLLFVLASITFTTNAQDYEKMIIGKWKLIEMVSGENVATPDMLGDVWMQFNEDKTMSFYYDGEEDKGEYRIEGNTIYDVEDEESGKIIINEVTSTYLELKFVADEEGTMIMKFDKM